MSPLALLEFRLEEPTVIEPLRIKHIAIHIIVKYPNLPVIPRIENERLIVVERVMPQRFPNDSRQAFTPVAHVNGMGTEIEPDTVAEQDHGYDIFSSSIATTDILVLFISTFSPVGDWRISC